MNRSRHILAVGASVRAVAQSLKNGGYEVSAADLFGDADLQKIAHTQRLANYADVAQRTWPINHHAWIFTGGLENHPTLVDEISSRVPLLGNHGDVLRAVRDLRQLQRILSLHGFHMPEMVEQLPLKHDNDWLQKSSKSAGGLLVQRARSQASVGNDESEYFQRFIPGRTLGALFVADHVQAHCLGVTEQLTPSPWTAQQEFLYAGSVGPVQLDVTVASNIMELGNVIARCFQLRGWFGVDCVLDTANRLWILEVNPRYSASLELCERAADHSTARWHVQSCEGTLLNDAELAHFREASSMHGKAIVYARAPVLIQPEQLEAWLLQAENRRDIADIPADPGVIPQGLPIVTLFATGKSVAEVRSRLASSVTSFEQTLHYTEPVASFKISTP